MLAPAADGSFLVSPSVGLILWTLVAVVVSTFVLYVLFRVAIREWRERDRRR
jgi:ABC-type transport system involved in Fe-S cluster assembly fused permease/ATPase subunit